MNTSPGVRVGDWATIFGRSLSLKSMKGRRFLAGGRLGLGLSALVKGRELKLKAKLESS